jgi:hypothetical protein
MPLVENSKLIATGTVFKPLLEISVKSAIILDKINSI